MRTTTVTIMMTLLVGCGSAEPRETNVEIEQAKPAALKVDRKINVDRTIGRSDPVASPVAAPPSVGTLEADEGATSVEETHMGSFSQEVLERVRAAKAKRAAR